MSVPHIDSVDRRILTALQRDGRLSNVELAEQIDLSPSPTLRRVRILEREGIITGYRATLSRSAVFLGLTVFVRLCVDIREDIDSTVLENSLAEIPQVVSCYVVSGSSDFLLEIVVSDLSVYEHLLTKKLLKLPGVSDILSEFAIRTIKDAAPLPLTHVR